MIMIIIIIIISFILIILVLFAVIIIIIIVIIIIIFFFFLIFIYTRVLCVLAPNCLGSLANTLSSFVTCGTARGARIWWMDLWKPLCLTIWIVSNGLSSIPLFVLILTIFQLGFGYGSDSSAFFSVPIDAADRAHGLFDVELLPWHCQSNFLNWIGGCRKN